MKNKNIASVLEDIMGGVPVIVVDDDDREFEGDLLIAAEKANIENIAFSMRHARGLMCLPCNGKILEKLQIPMMVRNPTDKLGTPFTVSIDANTTKTGMSVHDRLKTISVLLNENSTPDELHRPGHLFPLRPREKLLLERRGHTEASIELLKLADLKEVAVIMEIMNEDGTMAKGEDLEKFAKLHNLKIISVDEIYREVYLSNRKELDIERSHNKLSKNNENLDF